MNDNIWEKVSRSIGLYRYVSSGRYFAQVRFKGKLYRKSLETTDGALAKRRLADFRRTLDRTDPTQDRQSFAAVLDCVTRQRCVVHRERLKTNKSSLRS